MVNSFRNVLWLWGASLFLFTLLTTAVSYFLTVYQAQKLNDTFQSQYRKLNEPVPHVPEVSHTRLSEQQPVDVASLLTQAARQQKVSLHYRQDSQKPEQWLVGVSGGYQNAVNFVATIFQAQRKLQQYFPLTQMLKWQDTEAETGKLSWQFMWVNAESFAPQQAIGSLQFKTDFPQVTAEPLKCLSQPQVHSDITISDWSSVQLLATQTSPLQKALLSMPEQPLLTLSEGEWIASPLMRLQRIHQDYTTFQHWKKAAGCWSAQPVTLYLTQDTNSQ